MTDVVKAKKTVKYRIPVPSDKMVVRTLANKKQAADEGKTDPAVTGKGISKAVKQMIADGELPTQADMDRRAKEAKQKATKVVLGLPPSPNDIAILKTTKLHPETKVMRFHTARGWGVCLVWLEQVEKEGYKTLGKIHVITQGESGELDYQKHRPEELRNLSEIMGGYPIGPAIDAFRKHADLLGADRSTRELLGMSAQAPPKMVTEIVRDDNGNETGKRVVPKSSRPGSNTPQPSAELDELYKRASKLLDAKEVDLRNKYKHLNNGLQAMNLRNRLRNKGFNV